jgi:hypothetical protein
MASLGILLAIAAFVDLAFLASKLAIWNNRRNSSTAAINGIASVN